MTIKVRLDAPHFTRFIDVNELVDVLVFEGQVFRRDQIMYKTWGDPNTYTLQDEPLPC